MGSTPMKNTGNGAAALVRRVSRQDVARAAGVSATTVTHALNHAPGARMSEETRRRVARIAGELGYRPNFVGRALVSGRTYAVGLLQPSRASVFTDIYQSIIYGMAEAMADTDYHLLALFRSPDFRYLRALSQGRVDGVFVIQSDLETTHIEKVVAEGLPTVVVNKSYAPTLPRLGCVRSDHKTMIAAVVAELAELGCRSILEVNNYRSCDANSLIFEGFVEETGRRTRDGLAGSTMIPVREDFRTQFRNALESGQRWDGIFVDGIWLADIVIEEARAAGLQANRDYRLITSSYHLGDHTREGLEVAAYNQDVGAMGREAWEMMAALLEGRTCEEQQVLIPYRREPVAGGNN